MKEVHPPRSPRTPALALESWLRAQVPDGCPVARWQALRTYTKTSMLRTLGMIEGQLDPDDFADYAQLFDDTLADGEHAEEMARPPAEYAFRQEDLPPHVRAQLHTQRSVVRFVEDKDSGLFVAQEVRVVGGPFERSELPSYDKAVW